MFNPSSRICSSKKRVHLFLFFSTFLLSQIICLPSLAVTSSESSDPAKFLEKIYFVVLGTVLGFVASLLLDILRKRREAKRVISWDVNVKKGIIELEKDIEDIGRQEQLQVIYNGRPINRLAVATIVFQNVGDRDVKDQYLKISFQKGVKILDFGYQVDPEPEMGVSISKNFPIDTERQQAYDLAYLAPGQKWSSYFIVEWTGLDGVEMDLGHRNNSSESVSYIEGYSTKIESNKDIFKKFLIALTLFFILPMPVTAVQLLFPWSQIVVAVIRGILMVFILHLMPPAFLVLVDWIRQGFAAGSQFVQNNYGTNAYNYQGLDSNYHHGDQIRISTRDERQANLLKEDFDAINESPGGKIVTAVLKKVREQEASLNAEDSSEA